MMNNIIDVRICVGTYSYVMGGADLLNIESTFPECWKEKVKVTGVLELPGCDEKTMKPPFASVNGYIIDEATTEKIAGAIEKEMKKEK